VVKVTIRAMYNGVVTISEAMMQAASSTYAHNMTKEVRS
jgi:hypothetical protein